MKTLPRPPPCPSPPGRSLLPGASCSPDAGLAPPAKIIIRPRFGPAGIPRDLQEAPALARPRPGRPFLRGWRRGEWWALPRRSCADRWNPRGSLSQQKPPPPPAAPLTGKGAARPSVARKSSGGRPLVFGFVSHAVDLSGGGGSRGGIRFGRRARPTVGSGNVKLTRSRRYQLSRLGRDVGARDLLGPGSANSVDSRRARAWRAASRPDLANTPDALRAGRAGRALCSASSGW